MLVERIFHLVGLNSAKFRFAASVKQVLVSDRSDQLSSLGARVKEVASSVCSCFVRDSAQMNEFCLNHLKKKTLALFGVYLVG